LQHIHIVLIRLRAAFQENAFIRGGIEGFEILEQGKENMDSLEWHKDKNIDLTEIAPTNPKPKLFDPQRKGRGKLH